MSLFKHNAQFVLAVGAGAAIGAVLVRKFSFPDNDLKVLVHRLDEIHTQLKHLRHSIDEVKRSKTALPAAAESDEEDEEEDVFVEATEEFSDDFFKYRIVEEEAEDTVSQLPDAAAPPPAEKRLSIFRSRATELKGDIQLERLKLFTRVDGLMDSEDRDQEKAYNLLHDKVKLYSNDGDFLWRYAKAIFNNSAIVGAQGNKALKKDLITKAYQVGKDALKAEDTNANCHKWYAITLGKFLDYQSINDRIKGGFEFKEHIEKAIEINPDDAYCHHLLGRWCFEVQNLSWVEKKAAAALFSSPPSATIREALAFFIKAQNIHHRKWKENMLYIAKCYVQQKQYSEAAEWLFKAHVCPVESQEEREAHNEVESLIKKYGTYRKLK